MTDVLESTSAADALGTAGCASGEPAPDGQVVARVAGQFALLADPLRLQIVQALAREQLCTCHLIDITGAKQTTVSHHLRILREAGVIVGDAEGRYTWYHLVPGALGETRDALASITHDTRPPRLRLACTS